MTFQEGCQRQTAVAGLFALLFALQESTMPHFNSISKQKTLLFLWNLKDISFTIRNIRMYFFLYAVLYAQNYHERELCGFLPLLVRKLKGVHWTQN